MELVSKPNAKAAVWEHFGFKRNDHGEPLNMETVCRICRKTVSTKTSNTTNMHMHLKHNHPMQFSQLGKKRHRQLQRGRLRLPDRPHSLGHLVAKQNTNRTVQNGAHWQTV
ncbi:hypothetical protein PBY51_019496 [Eleginops maclovinus]|uniref:BED-type domain-containing protein n=1 Tax=Eleginops maclovinus TaxID=56733 RepID=A0AAN7YB66_ELEMC|nr:hypothetical protein PBY51_019496 [Eleginops maclovinus]